MVAAPARPNSGRQPGLVEKEPLGGPGNDGLRDGAVRTPLVVPIVVKAETGPGGILDVEIDVRSDLAGVGVAIDEPGRHQPHGHPIVQHRELLEEAARAVGDLDLMLLGDRREAPAPDREQAAIVVDQPESRIVATNEAILFLDRKRGHEISPSSWRCRRRSYGPARGGRSRIR
jgi:hypothetical protein